MYGIYKRDPNAKLVRVIPETTGRIYSDHHVEWEFDSFAAMVDAAERSDRMKHHGATPRSSQSRETATYRTGWYGTEDMREALNVARTGWPEGRERAAKMAARLTDAVKGRMKVTEYEAMMVGPIFDVGAYLQDDPLVCVVPVEAERNLATGGIVRIVIDVAVSAGVDADVMIRRGAAVVALVDALESQGRRCEVTATYVLGASPEGLSIKTVIKRAGDYVNVDAMAFAVAHPSAFRRLAFSIVESPDVTTLQEGSHGVPNGGYGRAQSMASLEADIRIKPADLYSSNVWSDDTAAMNEVLRMLKEQGVELSEAKA